MTTTPNPEPPRLLDIDGGPDVTPDFDEDPADQELRDALNADNPDYDPDA
jgi:hypothetical protein